MPEKTFAEYHREEEEALRRRFAHHTRPRRPLSMMEANDLCRRMAGEPKTKESPFPKTLGPL